MSGSSGSGGSGIDPIQDCASISFNTDVNSPQEAALQGLKIRDKLDVALEGYIVVVKRQDTHELVGSINWSSVAKLIECLNDDVEYIATIRDIQDGLIKVHVSPQ